MKLHAKESYDGGLLLLRVSIGLMFALVHGLPKVLGGASMWMKLGGAFNRLIGVAFVPAFWGFMATVAEFGGGLCLALGLFFRPACGLMLFTLTIAVFSILRGGYGFAGASQPIELGVVLFSLLLTGPGRFTFSHAVTTSRSRS